MTTALLLAALLGAGAPDFAPAPSGRNDSIGMDKVLQSLRSAFGAGDAAAIAESSAFPTQVVAHDQSLEGFSLPMDRTGLTETWRAAFAWFGPGAKANLGAVKTEFLSPVVVQASGAVEFKGSHDGRAATRSVRIALLLVKDGAGWKVRQWTLPDLGPFVPR